ncbi:hypothetical protein [Agromyces arachidis]|uniref:hypothetical protein n=1 Tax=Agromyces arachidis TaxID=766966 RepID=UPI004056E8BB
MNGWAAEWAERADETALAVRPDELDRLALAGLPETRDALVAFGRRSAHDLEDWRERRLERLRREEPGVAATIRPHGAVTCGFIAAALAVALAYALFFSRGDLGLAVEVVTSAISLVIGTVLMAAVMPWSRRRPVTAGDVTLSCLIAGLGAAAAVATVVQSRQGSGLEVPAAVAASCGTALVVMAVAVIARRASVPRSVREAEAERVTAVRAEFGDAVARARRDGGAHVDATLDAADPDRVAAARAELETAYEVLRRRRLVDASVVAHRPGLLLVDGPIGLSARATKMPDEGRLVPALAPRR